MQQAEIFSPTATSSELLGFELGVGINWNTIVVAEQGGIINAPSLIVFPRSKTICC